MGVNFLYTCRVGVCVGAIASMGVVGACGWVGGRVWVVALKVKVSGRNIHIESPYTEFYKEKNSSNLLKALVLGKNLQKQVFVGL